MTGQKLRIGKRLNSLHSISIKKLTLLGFSLVLLPLAIALLYSVNQINELSKQGKSAVFNVAQLNQVNRELSLTRGKFERVASQFVILKDPDLLTSVQRQSNLLIEDIAQQFKEQRDPELTELAKQFVKQVTLLHYILVNEPLDFLNLDVVKDHFQALAHVNQEINDRSNELIKNQAIKIEADANQISQTMLHSLFIIPLTLLIASFFVVLITTPLKQLLVKIKELELGSFDHEIAINGAPEVKEIADALELMRSRLHALELQKSSFIRHISHELKTPLAAIREGTELIYDNSVGELNTGQHEIVEIIKHSVTRLQTLIEDLLDFNIVLDSTSLQDSESIVIEDVIQACLKERSLDIKRKGLVIEQLIQPAIIQCNAKQLSVILDNLLSNAIKYSPEKGVLTIKSYIEDNHINLSISDQGPGIPSEIASQVFDAFYQGQPPNDNPIKSSGLGLTIVKELIMRLNGAIEVSSAQKAVTDTLREGCTFSMSLTKAKVMKDSV